MRLGYYQYLAFIQGGYDKLPLSHAIVTQMSDSLKLKEKHFNITEHYVRLFTLQTGKQMCSCTNNADCTDLQQELYPETHSSVSGLLFTQ